MTELIDMTGTDGLGWQPCTIVHRCSMPKCRRDAVAFYASMVGGRGRPWSKHARHVRHKYVCRPHLEQHGSAMRVIDNRIMRERYEWEQADEGV